MFSAFRTLALVAAVAALCGTASSQTLRLGDKAPALSGVKWIKGVPFDSLDKGRLNVVEFWATWCGPCKESIPHLSELQRKYGDRVTFTGVSVWENRNGWDDATYTKVSKFVADMGDQMAHNVVADSPESTMARNWMESSGQTGIPAAFVVGGDGRILWIGHPMNGLGSTLDKILSNGYDLRTEIDRQEKERTAKREHQALMKPYADAMKAKDYAVALRELDGIMARDAKNAEKFAYLRFTVLLRADELKAYAYAAKLADGRYRDDPQTLNSISWSIVDEASHLAQPDYSIALSIAKRASELTQNKDPLILDTLALAFYRLGQVDEAITLQERALSLSSRLTPDLKKEISGRLAMFKAHRSRL